MSIELIVAIAVGLVLVAIIVLVFGGRGDPPSAHTGGPFMGILK